LVEVTRKAEVNEASPSLRRDNDIARLDVSMDNTPAPHRLNGLRDIVNDRAQVLNSQWCCRNESVHRLAIDELSRDNRKSVSINLDFPGPKQPNNCPALEPCEQFDLSVDALEELSGEVDLDCRGLASYCTPVHEALTASSDALSELDVVRKKWSKAVPILELFAEEFNRALH
jgi:hypothetical protein